MALTEEDHKLIDDILLEKLSEQKSVEAKKRAKNDIEFSLELKNRLNMVKSLQQSGTELNEEFKQMLSLSKNKPSTNTIPLLKIAATLLLLITVSLVIWNFIPSQGERLFNSYYTPYPEPKILRGNNTDIDLNNAFSAYSDKDFKTALDEFLKHPKTSVELNLYIGNCYLQLGKIHEAEKIFLSSSSEHFKWYLAFTYLKMNKSNQALDLFQELVNSSLLYKEKSNEILQKLQ